MVVHAIDDNNVSVSEWFRSLPIITQYWFGSTVALTLAGNFGVVNPMYLLYSWYHIRSKFELWRIVTSFCYAGPFSMGTLFTVYMLHNMSIQYEKGPFNTGAGGGTADYAFALLFGMGMILVTYPIVTSFLPMPPMFCKTLVFFVMYIWSKRNPNARSNIWGIPIPGVWLPFAYMALTVCMGGPWFDLLHGLSIGHIYYFLADVVPNVQGRDILVTPHFLIDRFGIGQYQPQVEPAAAAAVNQPARGGGPVGPAAAAPARAAYQWGGTGRRLGRD